MIACEFENGKKTSLRHVTVAAIVVNEKNQVLLTKRAQSLHNGGKYTIPGGFLDRDEDIKQGVLRELEEETGLTGKIKVLFQIVGAPDRPKEDRQNVEFRYVVDIVGGTIRKSKETSAIGWFNVNNIPPDREFAFDHKGAVLKYFEYLNNPFSLPIFN